MRCITWRVGLAAGALAAAGLLSGCVREHSAGWSSNVVASAEEHGMSAGDSLGHAMHSSRQGSRYAHADSFEAALHDAASADDPERAVATVPEEQP